MSIRYNEYPCRRHQQHLNPMWRPYRVNRVHKWIEARIGHRCLSQNKRVAWASETERNCTDPENDKQTISRLCIDICRGEESNEILVIEHQSWKSQHRKFQSLSWLFGSISDVTAAGHLTVDFRHHSPPHFYVLPNLSMWCIFIFVPEAWQHVNRIPTRISHLTKDMGLCERGCSSFLQTRDRTTGMPGIPVLSPNVILFPSLCPPYRFRSKRNSSYDPFLLCLSCGFSLTRSLTKRIQCHISLYFHSRDSHARMRRLFLMMYHSGIKNNTENPDSDGSGSVFSALVWLQNHEA